MLSFRSIIAVIVGSTFTLAAIFITCLFGSRIVHNWRAAQPAYHLTHILQIPAGSNTLSAPVLIEMLGLSVDIPLNLYSLELDLLAERLASASIFSLVKLSKSFPNTLVVEYSLRTPIGLLANYSNTAFDAQGALFPLQPYYPFKELPSLFIRSDFGNPLHPWRYRLSKRQIDLFLKISPTCSSLSAQACCPLWSIDFSDLDANCLHEFTLSLKNSDQNAICTVRATEDSFFTQIDHLLTIRDHFKEYPPVVDLRFFRLALIAR